MIFLLGHQPIVSKQSVLLYELTQQLLSTNHKHMIETAKMPSLKDKIRESGLAKKKAKAKTQRAKRVTKGRKKVKSNKKKKHD